VVCFSYLATAELWTVPRFPLANFGPEVVSIERSIAADAPMTAAVLAALGVPTLLLGNDIGAHQKGAEVLAWLRRQGVDFTARAKTGTATPRITVVADGHGTRTWFPYLPGVTDSLAALDLSLLEMASFAYIDCYQLIDAPAARAVGAVQAAGIPLLLNLGGSSLSAAVVAALRGCQRLIVQTSVDEAAFADAPQVAALILAATRAT